MAPDGGDLTLFVVRVEDHAPVPNSKVTLSGRARSGDRVALAVFTDTEGRAAFEDAPPGVSYRARIEAPGLPPRTVEGLAVRRGLSTRLLPVFVGPLATMEGRFVDEGGAPVAGAEVHVHDEVRTRSEEPPVYDAAEFREEVVTQEVAPLGTTITDADGGYRIASLPAGPLEVRATAAGYRETVARVFLPPPGGEPERITRTLWRGADVTGVVVDAGGRPVPAVEVVVSSATGGTAERRRTTTGADGRFALTVAHSGPFFVLALDRSSSRFVSRRFQSPPSDVTIPWTDRVPFLLTVTDRATERPLPDASVELGVRPTMEATDGEAGWMTKVSGSTDAAGRFAARLPAGFIASVVLTAPGHVGATIDTTWWIPDGDVEAVQQLFGKELVAGSELEVAVALPGASEPDTAGIAGRVLDEEGRPVAGARIGSWSLGSLGVHGARADTRGDFLLDGFAAEELVVRARGFVQRAEDRACEADPSGRRTARVHRGATIRGRVVGPDGRGVAGAFVSILPERRNDGSLSTRYRDAWDAFRDPYARTAADGTFVMNDAIPLFSVPMDDLGRDVEGAGPTRGPARLAVRARTFVDALSGPFVYAATGVTAAPTVTLSHGAHVVGRVVDEEGHPLANLPVSLTAIGDGTTHAALPADGQVHSGAEGTFHVFALPIGELQVTTGSIPGHDGGRVTIPVTGQGALVPFDVVLHPTPPPGTARKEPPVPLPGPGKCG